MAMLEKLHDPPGTAVAAGLVVLGGVLIAQTGSMTPLGSVFPITVSAAMMALGAVLIVRNVVLGLRGGKAAAAEDEAAGGSTLRRVLFFAVMVAWVALLPVLGFFTASVLGFFAVMATALHERTSMPQAMLLALAGFAIVGLFYWVMRDVLLIPLPQGLFL